jgi:hypothetical protein
VSRTAGYDAIPELHVPGWSQAPSGLIVPSADLAHAAQAPADVPQDLLPRAKPVLVEKHPPTPMDQFLVYIDENELQLTHSSLSDALDLVRCVPAEPGVALLAKLIARVRQIGFRGEGQMALAYDFYGQNELTEHMAALVREGPSRRIFAEQSIHLLVWLLLVYGSDGPPTANFSGDAHVRLRRALLACTSILGDATRRFEISAPREDLLAFFVQISAYYRRETPLYALARSRALIRIALSEWGQQHHQSCSLNEWHKEAYGVDLDEQLRLGFGLSAMSRAFEDGEAAGSRVYLSRENVDDYLLKAGLLERRDQALALISATRAQFAAELHAVADSIESVVWEDTLFKRFPFLRCLDGGLILLSPVFAQSWTAEGFHYRSLAAAEKRDEAQGTKKRRESQRYSNFAGAVYERYCLDLTRSAHAGNELAPARIFGEQPYKKDKRKLAGKGEKTSDIAVDLGPDLVLFETTASRLSLVGLRTGTTESVVSDLERCVVGKINQLDNCINQLVGEHAELPGVAIRSVERIWPVLVTGGAVLQSPALWDYLDARCPLALSQARVQPLTLLDPEDLERLLGLVEAGHPLPELLSAKTSKPYARVDFAYWMTRDPLAPRDARRAQSLGRSFSDAMESAMCGIDFSSGTAHAARGA